MKKTQIAVLAVLISFFSAYGMAGVVQPAPVEVDLGNQNAQGDMVTARFSDNDVEYIGCGVRTFEGAPSFSFGFCQAGDADGNEVLCFSQNPDLLDAIKAISDYSFITFSWDSGLVCTRIGNSTQSWYIPELKLKK